MTEHGQQKDNDKAQALHHEYKVRKNAKSAARKTEKMTWSHGTNSKI